LSAIRDWRTGERAPCQPGMRSIRFAPAGRRSTPVRAVPPFPAGACSLPAEIRLGYVKRASIDMGPGAQLLAQMCLTTHCGGLLRRLSLPAGHLAPRAAACRLINE